MAVAKTLQDLSFSSLSASSPAAKKANAKPEKNVGDSFKTRRAEFTSEESTMKMSQSGLRPTDPSTLRVGVPLLVLSAAAWRALRMVIVPPHASSDSWSAAAAPHGTGRGFVRVLAHAHPLRGGLQPGRTQN